MGLLLAYPWFDRLSLWALVRYYFPLSRMWAAALISDGVPERFLDELSLKGEKLDLDRLQGVLFHVEATRATAAAVDDAWTNAFFGDEDLPDEALVAIETARLDQSHRLNSLRNQFRYLCGTGLSIQRPAPPTPAEVENAYGKYLGNRSDLFAFPEHPPAIQVSRPVPGVVGTDYWLRFRSPSLRLNDTVYARVHEPDGVKNPPTLVFGHGICVDFDHWRGLIDEVDDLVSMGVRVIRPEAPFHGRRRPDGRYSGEAIVATTPFGPLDAFTGAIREWSVMLDWARRTSDGPLAVGGSSLGALMSLLCADVARDWPERVRPRAMLLITHCGRQRDALIDGGLAKAWKSIEAMEEVGWTSESIAKYIDLLNPSFENAPIVDPKNIISVLGKYDHITPFNSGVKILDAWNVPAENRFIWKRGHFSVPMTMIRNTEPLKAFHTVLQAL